MEELQKEIEQIVNAVSKLKYYQWCQIRDAIDKKYSQVSSKVQISDTQELANLIISYF